MKKKSRSPLKLTKILVFSSIVLAFISVLHFKGYSMFGIIDPEVKTLPWHRIDISKITESAGTTQGDAELGAKGTKAYAGAKSNEKKSRKGNEPYNVLLGGVDSHGFWRSVMVAHVVPRERRASLLYVSPDSFVEDSGESPLKLSAVLAADGEKVLVDTVENLLKIEIENYVFFNSDAVVAVIDALGGVFIDVEKDMFYNDPAEPYFIDLDKGKQLLDGDTVLQYSKFCYDSEGLKGRVKRQKKVVTAVADRVTSLGTIVRLPKLIKAMYKYSLVETDISIADVYDIGKSYDKQMFRKLEVYTLPGEQKNINGSNFFVLDEKAISKMMEKI